MYLYISDESITRQLRFRDKHFVGTENLNIILRVNGLPLIPSLRVTLRTKFSDIKFFSAKKMETIPVGKFNFPVSMFQEIEI